VKQKLKTTFSITDREKIGLRHTSKDIHVTGRGVPKGSETWEFLNFVNNRLTDGGHVVSLERRSPFTPQEDSLYSFLLEVQPTPGHSSAGRIR
jgi:hypothetical protein